MNFEKKMKERGNQKIESLVETPSFIKITKKKETKKRFPLWAKIAIPSSLGLVFSATVVVVFGISLSFLFNGMFAKNSARAPGDQYAPTSNNEEGHGYGGSGEGQEPGASDSTPVAVDIDGITYSVLSDGQESFVKEYVDIDLSKSTAELIGEEVTNLSNVTKEQLGTLGNYSLYHIQGSSSSFVYIVCNGVETHFISATKLNALYDSDIDTLLTFFGVEDDYQIKVFDYKNTDGKYSYSDNIYDFSTEDSKAIVNTLKTINSDYSSFSTEYDSAEKSKGLLKGISHKLVFSDGVDFLPAVYYSQLSSINMPSMTQTSFDIKDTSAYTLMDDKIEMDYDPNYVIL